MMIGMDINFEHPSKTTLELQSSIRTCPTLSGGHLYKWQDNLVLQWVVLDFFMPALAKKGG